MVEQVYGPREYNSWPPNLFQFQICQFLSCLGCLFLPFPSTWITCLPINSLHFSSFSGNVISSESIPDLGLLPTHFAALLGFLSLSDLVCVLWWLPRGEASFLCISWCPDTPGCLLPPQGRQERARSQQVHLAPSLLLDGLSKSRLFQMAHLPEPYFLARLEPSW